MFETSTFFAMTQLIGLIGLGTRHERLPEIIAHSIRSMLWVLTFMGIIFAVIFAAGYLQ